MNDRNNNPDNKSLIDMPALAIQHIGSYMDTRKNMVSYAVTCKTINTFFQPDFDELHLQELLYAIVNDSNIFGYVDVRKRVNEILSVKPWLLLKKPRTSTTIERFISISLGEQIFYAEEEALVIALKCKRIGMVKLILTYFNQLEDGKAKALAQWKTYEITEDEKQRYADRIKKIVNLIAEVTFQVPFTAATTATWEAIMEFLKNLKADVHIAEDNYVDVEQMLIAGYKANCSILNLQQESMYSDFLGIIKNSLPEEVRLFFKNNNALHNNDEMFENRKICDDFFLYVEQRQNELAQLKTKLLNDFLADTYRNIESVDRIKHS